VSVPQVEIQLIAIVVAVACALPGVFLVLRRLSLMSDAISHSILLGIVLAFFAVRDLASPLLVAAATATGVLTVSLVQLLARTRLVRNDAAIGIVFPALFSIAVILISRYAGDIHLDTDAVLLGELAFAPFNRFEIGGRDVGPIALWVMGGILLLNVVFFTVFYKELKLSTFDPGLAATLGFVPGILHYALMTLVSVTAVGAFDAVGSVLVVALMIVPPACAHLLTDRLSRTLLLSAAIGAAAAVSGYWLAYILDASIAGCMAAMCGAEFVLAFLFAPDRGMVALARRRARQKLDFAVKMLAIHLLHHEGKPEADTENRVDHLEYHIRWSRDFAGRVVRRAQGGGIVENRAGALILTDHGRRLATESMVD
jgi:manganese/zinc/iron transport system permease protein